MIFDTHAHYDSREFDGDRDELIASLPEHGIGRVVNVGARLEGSRNSVRLSEQYDHFYAAVGVHPDDCGAMEESWIDELRELASHEKVVAIGEIGLDYHGFGVYEDKVDKETQKYWFWEQLMLAKELARNLRIKKIPFEYGLLAAGAYVGQMTWHGMLSASIGLSIATSGHALEDMIGVIPMSEYMLNPMNIIVTIALAVFPPLFACLLQPKNAADFQPLDDEAIHAIEKEDMQISKRPENASVGDFLNYNPVIAWVIGIMGFIYVFWRLGTRGIAGLDIDLLNFIFLFGGILLYGNIANYVRAVKEAVGGVSGIIFQFPLYAGVLGMVKYSGLVTILANGIVAISNDVTFYLWTFLSASLVNMFVPSGGGQWAVQGPIAIESAKIMGANMVKTCLMIAYGNTWTNMAQPFWAIALLGITGLKAKDIMGYSIAIMLLSGFIFIGASFLPV